jgi:hypothetical protein
LFRKTTLGKGTFPRPPRGILDNPNGGQRNLSPAAKRDQVSQPVVLCILEPIM